MKRLLLAVALLAVILTLGICEQVYITKSFDALKESIESVKIAIEEENYEKADEEIQKIREKWRATEDVLELIAPHTDVKEIMIEISHLDGYLKTGMYEEALSHSMVVSELCENRKHILQYRWKNVF